MQLLRESYEEFLTFEFDGQSSERMVFPRQELLAATEEILSDNGLRSQGSPDMLALWNAKNRTIAQNSDK